MSDVGIDLDFGGIDAIIPGTPVPDGVYELRIDDAKVIPTKDQRNNMIEVRSVVDCPQNHELAKYNGRAIIDNWFLPNPATQTPEDVGKTKGFLRGRLETITGKEWGSNGMKLVPRELAGLRYKALVAKVDEGFGPQNRIRRYMPLNSDEQLGYTAPAAPRPQQNTQPVAAGATPGGGEAPRFRI